jgi:hypothetical protein
MAESVTEKQWKKNEEKSVRHRISDRKAMEKERGKKCALSLAGHQGTDSQLLHASHRQDVVAEWIDFDCEIHECDLVCELIHHWSILASPMCQGI